ncbi:MAG: thiamine-phosphate kinase [Thermodesulfobacteriota bacterium]
MTLSEKEIISRIRQGSRTQSGDLLVGIGDDCAVIRRGNGLVEVVTTDTLVEKVHFDRDWHDPQLLGRKAAAVNLSDVAAMGARPRFALLSIGLPAELPAGWLDDFMAGFMEILGEYNTDLVGGDTVASGGGLVFSVTIIGEVEEDKLLLRSGARSGDRVMVSGPLGNAAAGLDICRRKKDGWAEGQWPNLVQAHLDPVPEVVLGGLLADSGMVSAMMDLSDGLATDLAHLCAESRVGAEIESGSIPMTGGLRSAAEALDRDPSGWALSGGEDYRLLCTVPPDDEAALQKIVRNELGRELYSVGRIVDGSGVFLLEGEDRRDISYQGYDHFS